MLPQSKGKMFLADERGLNQLDWYRSYNTFNFGAYQHQYKAPFSTLYVLNDDTLAGQKSISFSVDEDTEIILIPIVGTVAYQDSLGNTDVVKPGQTIVLPMPKGTTAEFSNHYEDELINFIHLWIKRPGISPAEPIEHQFNIEANLNKLVPLFNTGSVAGVIGLFNSQKETVYEKVNPENVLFAFVIDGDFEVQYRLMHPRDGLVLWDVDEIEIEALSNHAIIIVLETTT